MYLSKNVKNSFFDIKINKNRTSCRSIPMKFDMHTAELLQQEDG